jgi:hypothetical protein
MATTEYKPIIAGGTTGHTPIISKQDLARWSRLVKNPDWYLTLVPEMRAFRETAHTQEEKKEVAITIYSFFERKMANGTIALGGESGVWDTARKPISSIIIHHTGRTPGITQSNLSATELVRLYAPYYAEPLSEEKGSVNLGAPIASGHIRDGKQIFWPYHWVVRMDGRVEQLLYDFDDADSSHRLLEVGWQAGDWRTNCESVAIVFDNNYENSRPTPIALQATANLIKKRYLFISKDQIIGHREVKRTVPGKTTCPGNLFLDHGIQRGWKEDLLNLI